MRGFADGGWQGEFDGPQEILSDTRRDMAPAHKPGRRDLSGVGFFGEKGKSKSWLDLLRQLYRETVDDPSMPAAMTGLPSVGSGVEQIRDSKSGLETAKGVRDIAIGALPATSLLRATAPIGSALYGSAPRAFGTSMLSGAPEMAEPLNELGAAFIGAAKAADAPTRVAQAPIGATDSDDPMPVKPVPMDPKAPRRSLQTTMQVQTDLMEKGFYRPIDRKTGKPTNTPDGEDGSATRQAEFAAAMAKYEKDLEAWRTRQAATRGSKLETDKAAAERAKAETDRLRIEEEAKTRSAAADKKTVDDQKIEAYEKGVSPWANFYQTIGAPAGAIGLGAGYAALSGWLASKGLGQRHLRGQERADKLIGGNPQTLPEKIGKVNPFFAEGQPPATRQNLYERTSNKRPFWERNKNAPSTAQIYPEPDKKVDYALGTVGAGALPTIELAITLPRWLATRQELEKARKDFLDNPNDTTNATYRDAQQREATQGMLVQMGGIGLLGGPLTSALNVRNRPSMRPKQIGKAERLIGEIDDDLANRKASAKKSKAKRGAEKSQKLEAQEPRQLPKPNGSTGGQGGSGGAAPLLPLAGAPLLTRDQPSEGPIPRSSMAALEDAPSFDTYNLPYALGGVTRRHHSHYQPRARKGRFAGGPVYPETYDASGRDAMADGGVPDWMGGGGGGPPWISSLLQDRPLGTSVQAASPGLGQPIGMTTGFTPGAAVNAASPSQTFAQAGAPASMTPPIGAPQVGAPQLGGIDPRPSPPQQTGGVDPRLGAPPMVSAVMPPAPQLGGSPWQTGGADPNPADAVAGPPPGQWATTTPQASQPALTPPATSATAPAPTAAPMPQRAAVMPQQGAGGGLFGQTPLGAALNYRALGGRANGGAVHTGPVVGATGGRSDKLPVDVENGAYVIPADVVSALGEGNTLAGMETLKKRYGQTYRGAMAAGGSVPIMISDGEYVISPAEVAAEGGGDMNRGHKILDSMVRKIRAQNIKRLASLPPPAK